MKVKKVIQLKAIQLSDFSFVFPFGFSTKIIIDHKGKEHQLLYQQGRQYGESGDCCTYLNNQELLRLQSEGMIKINP